MAIYPGKITTESANGKQAYQQVKAYAMLFAIEDVQNILVYIKGTFSDLNGGFVFLRSFALAEITTQGTIKWYDQNTQRTIKLVPADATFELALFR